MKFKNLSVKALSFIICISIITLSSFVFAGDMLTASHDCSRFYMPGDVQTVTTVIEYTGEVTALGVQVVLPEGWSFASVYGDYEPAVKPETDSSGLIDFAWVEIPESPFSFTYTVAVPEGDSGEKEISSTMLYRRLGDELQESAIPNPLILSR